MLLVDAHSANYSNLLVSFWSLCLYNSARWHLHELLDASNDNHIIAGNRPGGEASGYNTAYASKEVTNVHPA